MADFNAFFASFPHEYKFFWLLACLIGIACIETIIPLRKTHPHPFRHLKVNISLLISTGVINTLFSSLVLLVSAYTAKTQFGVLYWLSLPAWLELLIAILFMDFLAQYLIHFLLHKVPILWRFHKVHHSDTHVSVTTGTRHHPIDYLLRETFSLSGVLILGLPPEYYVIYRLLTVFFTYFTHANIHLPPHIDRAISFIFISPNTHKFHHHHEMPWTDTNFGNIFVFWDKLFGTFVYQDTQQIYYGVDTMDESKADSLGYQLGIPFKR